jgi:predicted TIM-barrel fold metal-dependent hydrolase
MSQRRVVALEEAFSLPDLVATIDPARIASRGWPLSAADEPASMQRAEALADLGERRIADMDAAGVTVQVLSSAMPGPELLEPTDAIRFSRNYNDRLARVIVERPERYAGFATLPTTAPEAAADELERAVTELGFVGALINGTTDGLFLDHPSFSPILERTAALSVPLYLHPNLPIPSVYEAYYSGLPGTTGFALSMAGWGWHAETAVHVLRLVLSGAFDRFPTLQVIIGHMGEGLPGMMARFDDIITPEATHLTRAVSRTILDHVWITTSGFFTVPAFLTALTTFGVERILFSVDYPYADNQKATSFLESLPVSPFDKDRIAHRNADTLLGLRP